MKLLDDELRAKLIPHLGVWALLLGLVSAISAVGVLAPHGHWWIVEVFCLACEVVVVLVFSMEMFHHRPIVRLFSVLGFFWVAILFSFTMLDYATR